MSEDKRTPTDEEIAEVYRMFGLDEAKRAELQAMASAPTVDTPVAAPLRITLRSDTASD
jgi:hypothetical protein